MGPCSSPRLDAYTPVESRRVHSTPHNVFYDCFPSNHYNKLGLNQRQTFLGLRHILNKTQLQVQRTMVATPLKELGKHRVVDMSLGPTHSSLVVDTGKVGVAWLWIRNRVRAML